MKKNYYEVLEVSSKASPEIIEKAYKTLTRKYHPDLQSKDKKNSSENQFKEIVKAYEVLSDPEKRAEYDEYQQLKQKVDSLENGSDSSKSSEQKNNKIDAGIYVKTFVESAGNIIYNHTKKSKEERSRDIKALAIALGIMIILIVLFWKIPVLRTILFP